MPMKLIIHNLIGYSKSANIHLSIYCEFVKRGSYPTGKTIGTLNGMYKSSVLTNKIQYIKYK